MSIQTAIKINGFKYRSWKQPDGTWTDPFVEFDFWSRTMSDVITEYIEFTEESEVLKEVKKTKYKFKEGNLSIKSKEKFDEKKIKYDK